MEKYLNILLLNPNISQNSKYVKWYFNIISSKKFYNDEKIEEHHILPKSIYPEYKNDKINLIKLSLREHYVVHLLLWKMFNKNSIERSKMAFAVKRFRKGNSEIFMNARKYALIRSDLKHSEETKNKIRQGNIGKKVSAETIEKLKISHQGYKHSDETKEKLRLINTGKKLSPEHAMKISESNKGKIVSEESKSKMSKAKIGKKGKDHSAYGFVHSEDVRQRMSEAHKGKKLDENTKNNIRIAHKDKIFINDGNITKKVNKITVLEDGWEYGMHPRK